MLDVSKKKGIPMNVWKRNLIVCWFGTFVTVLGLSQIAPVLPLYIKQLGIQDTSAVEQFSGISFGITFIVAAFFTPIWGFIGDRYGRKLILLISSLGMAIITFLTGFAENVAQLIVFRLLIGFITGYSPTCTALIAAQTDNDHAGWSLGILSTAFLAGSLLGPMVGGFIVEKLGMQYVFFVTGCLLLISFTATLVFVKEKFIRYDEIPHNLKDVFKSIPEVGLTITMFTTFFTLQLALNTIEPIVTVYITELSSNLSHIALIAGLTFSISGMSSIIAAPWMGRLSDKVGSKKIILISLFAGGIIFIPQAIVCNPWQLMALRFLVGIAIAGLPPAINACIKRITPNTHLGIIFSLMLSAQNLGIFFGSILGGQVAAYCGIRSVFYVTSAFMLLNAFWVYCRTETKLV